MSTDTPKVATKVGIFSERAKFCFFETKKTISKLKWSYIDVSLIIYSSQALHIASFCGTGAIISTFSLVTG